MENQIQLVWNTYQDEPLRTNVRQPSRKPITSLWRVVLRAFLSGWQQNCVSGYFRCGNQQSPITIVVCYLSCCCYCKTSNKRSEALSLLDPAIIDLSRWCVTIKRQYCTFWKSTMKSFALCMVALSGFVASSGTENFNICLCLRELPRQRRTRAEKKLIHYA